jgi:hypothetical protein
MEITLLSRNKPTKTKIDQDHYWYDHVNKKMFHGKGGRLNLKYDSSKKQIVPEVSDEEVSMLQNDYPLLCQWVNKNQSRYNINIVENTGRNITISCHANSFDDIIHNLRSNSILFDYDHNQLVREMRRQ